MLSRTEVLEDDTWTAPPAVMVSVAETLVPERVIAPGAERESAIVTEPPLVSNEMYPVFTVIAEMLLVEILPVAETSSAALVVQDPVAVTVEAPVM